MISRLRRVPSIVGENVRVDHYKPESLSSSARRSMSCTAGHWIYAELLLIIRVTDFYIAGGIAPPPAATIGHIPSGDGVIKPR